MANPVLIFVRGPVAGRRITLENDETTIGRGRGNDIVLEDPLVSRVHAIVMRRGGVMLIEDFGSNNGTYVNHERLPGVRQLHHSDHIGIGTSRIVFEDPSLVADEPTEIAGAYPILDVSFTQRQLQVLRLTARGLSSRQMGERLSVTERTIKAYLSSIYEKLGVKNRAAAVTEALRLGLIDLPAAEEGVGSPD